MDVTFARMKCWPLNNPATASTELSHRPTTFGVTLAAPIRSSLARARVQTSTPNATFATQGIKDPLPDSDPITDVDGIGEDDDDDDEEEEEYVKEDVKEEDRDVEGRDADGIQDYTYRFFR